MAYLTAAVESVMKKGLKKAMKSKKRKCNHANDSPSSSDSDSKQEAGYPDTEQLVDKHLKLDKPFMYDLNSTKPRSIKVTDQIRISDNKANEKAVESAKTGKVTAVVAVMHLYSDSNTKLVNKITTNSAKQT